ncbi:diaminopimelate dehydrogenase [Proteiniborus sp. DW1]|uniref:diaminopimelate dehydrogenase n=1 Tax=Proteiniborus sp. DW1 TaxID=1889883 RepID=UPI00092E1322|nr:diaminopimelate dehydrogenase [Proteiniborus sp. DW1]SCG83858.1 diaminopimelate dehydrogenase [Proteiniborus sp. DW1]
MENKIKIGIVGYGNLGRGVELAVSKNEDMELIAVFTRRATESIKKYNGNLKIVDVNQACDYMKDIDVMILCGGSATDLPVQGPHFASMFNTVDGYDNHGKIPEYIRAMNEASMTSNKTSAVCIGWDPGLFSMNRILFESVLPYGATYTFWGPGISQGHSDAIRRIPGVKNAVQYTIPKKNVVKRIRNGETPALKNEDRHTRQCFVAVEEGVNKEEIIEKITSMANYFSGYDTTVNFVTEEEIKEKHSKMIHSGFVIRSGWTDNDCTNNHISEFSLKLDNNAEYTASVLVAYARAVYRLNEEGHNGVKTVFDIPLRYISNRTIEDLCANLL